ncbi:MAG: tetratricopeptide repeat protein [Thermodesulfobacteriota bacterium]
MKKSGIPFLLLVLVLSFPGSGPALADEVTIRSDEQFRLGQEAMQRGEYQRAVTELERFLHFFPDDELVPRVRYLIGLCYLQAKQYDKAREVFNDLRKAYAGKLLEGEALFMIGESYYRQGLYSEAEKHFRPLSEESPIPEIRNRAAYRLGWCRMKGDRWKDGSETFRKVDPASPLYPSARHLTEKSLEGMALPSKEPATAGALSALVPGLGHVYCERYKDGLVAFLLNGLFIWAAYESFHEDREVLGGILGFLELGWYSGSIYSAVNSAHKYNRAQKEGFLRNLRDDLDVGLFTTREGHVGMALQVRF